MASLLDRTGSATIDLHIATGMNRPMPITLDALPSRRPRPFPRLVVLAALLLLAASSAPRASEVDCYDYGETLLLESTIGLFSQASSGWPTAAAVDGAILYTSLGWHGVVCHDISDPAAPVALDTLTAAGNVQACAARNGWLYTVGHNQGMTVIDASDPSNLTVVGTWPEALGHDVAVVPGTSLVVTLWAGNPETQPGILHLVDVTDPTAPSVVGSADLPAIGTRMAAGAGRIVVAGQGLHVIDITTPSAPELVGSLEAWIVGDVALHPDGTVAYAADGAVGLRVVDLADPANPVTLATADVGQANRDMVWHRDMVFMASQSSGLQVVDVAGPATPQLRGRFALAPWSSTHAMAVDEHRAYVAFDTPQDLWTVGVFDISGVDLPARLGEVELAPTVTWTIAHGAAGTVAADWNGNLHVLDVTDPTAPQVLGTLHQDDTFVGMLAVAETTVGALQWAREFGVDMRLEVHDLADPHAPTPLGVVALDGHGSHGFSDLVYHDQTYLVAVRVPDPGGADILVIDASDPAAPVVTGLLDAPSLEGADALAVGNGVLYQCGHEGVAVWDLGESPPALREEWLAHPGPVDAAEICGSTLVLSATAGSAVRVLRLSPGEEPELAAELPVPQLSGMWAADGVAYASSRLGMVAVIDLADAAQGSGAASPRVIGMTGPVEANGVALVPDALAIASGEGSVVTFPTECLGGVTAAPDPAAGAARPATIRMSSPSPNPSHRGTAVTLQLDAAAVAEVTIFDLRGRLVRTLHAGVLAAGRHELAWDGKDAGGRAVASGTYVLRVRAAGEVASQKILVVR